MQGGASEISAAVDPGKPRLEAGGGAQPRPVCNDDYGHVTRHISSSIWVDIRLFLLVEGEHVFYCKSFYFYLRDFYFHVASFSLPSCAALLYLL